MNDKIMSLAGMAKQVVVEMKDHPLTLILIVALMVWSIHADITHAEKATVEAHVVSDSRLFTSINAQLDLLLELSLSDQLNSMQELWCHNNGQDRRDIERTMQGLKVQYRKATGNSYGLIPCRED